MRSAPVSRIHSTCTPFSRPMTTILLFTSLNGSVWARFASSAFTSSGVRFEKLRSRDARLRAIEIAADSRFGNRLAYAS